MSHLRAHLQSSLGMRFRIVRELTGGGMSRVFLAEEADLEREVAIKVLSPHLVDAELRERFRQEVLQTARLQHPTIVPLLDVGAVREESGIELPYYVMPYVRGESVRSRLTHEHQLSLGVVIRIMRNVLDALAHAHALGVIHRDVKPENVFLSGSTAVLADFGIAKAIRGARPSPNLTSPGRAVGSPLYMAPEQMAGDEAADHRVDIYAVGVLGFEMLTGTIPWEGRTASEILAARARQQTIRLRSLRPDAPAALEALLDQCIAWNPDDRPQSIVQVARELEAIGIMPSSTSSFEVLRVPRWFERQRRRSRWVAAAVLLLSIAAVARYSWAKSQRALQPIRLAVLAPALSSGLPLQTFARQVYQSLVGSLSPVAGLKVVGEVSVPQMIERGLQRDQILDSLSVDSALVVHALPTSSGIHQVSVELHRRSQNGGELIAGPLAVSGMDRLPPDSVVRIVRQLAAQVVTRLSLRGTEHSVPVTQRLESWIAWSEGHDAYGRRTPDGFREAIAHFERAIALDNTNVQAHAELAMVLTTALFYQYRVGESPYANAARALTLAERAVQLQRNYADGFLARGYLGTLTGAPVTFLEHNFAEARRLSSANTYSRIWYAALLAARGEYEAALSEMHDEATADPESPAKQVALGLYALPVKEYVTAIRVAQRVKRLQLPVMSQLELWARTLMKGPALSQCVDVPAGPYLGAKALCLEANRRNAEAAVLMDSLFRIVTGRAALHPDFEMSLYMSEMATYYAARRERVAAQQWMRQAFSESPNGIDWRFLRAGHFTPDLIAFSDSLRARAWERISASTRAAEADGIRAQGRAVLP